MIVCLLLKSIAFSQVTCIQDSTKREIVKTLLDYPLVLEELGLTKELVRQKDSVIANLNLQLDYRDYVIQNQGNEIENLLEQKKLYQEEIDRRKSGGFLYGQVNLNGFNAYGVGFDYVWKMSVIAGVNLLYDTFASPDNLNINAKLGFKLF